MISAPELISKIRCYHPNLNESLIQKAYILSKTAHGNQKRHSGDPYFSHPLAVAEILAELKLDQESIVTALLHDVVEDTDVSLEEIEKDFGENIARLVDGVTKLGKIESIPANETVAENFRKLAIAMSEDIRVLIVKLADRLHNMRTLFYMPSREKKVKKAQESLDIYAPLAGRIGLDKIKNELQELAFEIIDHEAYSQIVENLNEIREKNKNLTNNIVAELKEILQENEMDCEVYGREKKPYSIWLKMREKKVGFHNLHDVMAFRIVVSDIGDCYKALGIINSNYNMIPGTFKDYISTPKENGYQSLHLAILGPFNKKIEVQIRDQKMHEFSELGVAAHWRYKEKSSFISSKVKNENEQYRWIRDLMHLFENSETASEVLKNHKLQMHKDEVFCFTPNGDIFNLPLGATVLDFAYAVHSEVGNSCISAKVNGTIAPLKQKLENGDQIEIITAKNAKPSINWLQTVTTAKARSAIKNFVRNQKFSEYNALGKAIIYKYFSAKSLEINDTIIEKILPNFHKKNVADLYVRVAEGIISRYDVLKAAYPDFVEEQNQNKSAKTTLEKKKKNNHALPIEGLVSGMAMHYAGCCSPIPGDPIMGIINTGTGITIHNQRCRNLKNLVLLPQRIIDVCWKSDSDIGNELYASRVRVVVENKPGAFADVSSIIAKQKVNISNMKLSNRSADYFEMMVDVDVKSVEHLENIISSLRMSKKVLEVERVMG